MAYAIQLVEIIQTVFGLTSSNQPWPTNPFNTFLYSGWFCTSIGLLPGSTATGACNLTFDTINGDNEITIEVSQSTTPACAVTITRTGVGTIFNGTFTLPDSPSQCQRHMMVSIDSATAVIQVYANDVACPSLSGGWITPSAMFLGQPGGNLTNFDVGGGANANYPAMADVWASPTPSFVDLSVTANRRKFITQELNPVDLALDGSKPFGYSPVIFMRCETGVATDIATNYGTGKSFSISGSVALQSGICPVITIPVPPIGISFAEVFDPTYLDFQDEDYISFALSAWVQNPQAPITKLSAPYLVFYFNTDSTTNQVDMHFRWGFSQNPNSGKFSSIQRLITTEEANYKYQGLRRKVRGTGRAFQVGFYSVSGQPFDVTGWVIENSMNTQA